MIRNWNNKRCQQINNNASGADKNLHMSYWTVQSIVWPLVAIEARHNRSVDRRKPFIIIIKLHSHVHALEDINGQLLSMEDSIVNAGQPPKCYRPVKVDRLG